MLHDFVRVCERRFKDKISHIETSLGAGKANDWSNYRALCAEIKAYREAISVLKDCLKQRELDDDE